MSDGTLFGDDAFPRWQETPPGEPRRPVRPLPTPEAVGLARGSDPSTSKAGARAVVYRATSQKARLLRAFVDAEGPITDAEAATRAGLVQPGACWWRRCSSLREEGMIRTVGVGISPLTEEEAMTCEATDLGRAQVERIAS